jgi:hypothetical protein
MRAAAFPQELAEVARPYWASAEFVVDEQEAFIYHRGGGGGGADDESGEQHAGGGAARETFEPLALDSDRAQEERLGPPEPAHECFGCAYFGDADTALESADVERLRAMARTYYGCSNRVMLAERMAEYYASFRQRVNNYLLPGERALPEWSAAQILDHLEGIGHHNDPVVALGDAITETREIRRRLKKHLFERSNATGHERPNKVGFDCFEKMSKLLVHLMKQDPTKMAFHDRAAGVNATASNMSQGLMSSHTKQVVDLWK